MSHSNFQTLRAATALALGAAALLSACVDEPPPRQPPPRVAVAPSPPPPDTRVYAYATRGQSDEQQDRDRYECHRWAVSQSGFDPTQAGGGTPGEDPGSKRADYRRAIGACLEGRGYSVK